MSAFDKLLITHNGAVRAKYGPAGARAVRDGLNRLVEADGVRDFRSRIFDLDNYQSMKALGLPRVAVGDWVAAVRAVDLAAARYAPAYLVLIGASDVVPQARVENPFAGLGADLDPYVPSDLPYACDLPDDGSNRLPDLVDLPGLGPVMSGGDLVAATRVVGRLPDLMGASDPQFLLSVLAQAAQWQRRSPETYHQAFVVGAAAWHGSTMLTAKNLAGPTPVVHDSPPAQTGWAEATMVPRVHLINCHGADTTPDWFGQANGGAIDTTALAGEDIAGQITTGTVVAAECCFSAMHQFPSRQHGRLPLLAVYLGSGAHAALGSSCTSYGPADGIGQADLICGYFLRNVQAGFSSGRALLAARQQFVSESGALAPEDLKTLAQFDLLGDPSVHLVELPLPKGDIGGSETLSTLGAEGPKGARRQRRLALAAKGRALDAEVARAGRRHRRLVNQISAQNLAVQAGVMEPELGEIRNFGEHHRGPRRGNKFVAAAFGPAGDSQPTAGLVTAREHDGQLQARVILRK